MSTADELCLSRGPNLSARWYQSDEGAVFVRGISINPSQSCARAVIICSLTPLPELIYYSGGYNIAISQLELNLTTVGTGDTRILMSLAPRPNGETNAPAN